MNIKKGLFIVLGIAVLVAGLLALTACNGKKTGETTTAAPATTTAAASEEASATTQAETTKAAKKVSNDIVGSWKNNDYGSDFIYTFNADGTGKYDAAGTIMEFTYTTSGKKLSIMYTGNTVPFETEYSVKGDTLNVIDSIGNDTLYQKVK